MTFKDVLTSTTSVVLVTVAVAITFVVLAISKLLVVGSPNEWVLKIRNGKLLNAGIGIVAFRLPWQRVVRFTAAMQRVAFKSSALSSETLPLTVEGFVIWSISPHGNEPFTAFSKLGIVDSRELPDRADRYRKHLLQRPQYRAFQLLVTALVERQIARIPLRSLLSNPDEFVASFREQLTADLRAMGVVIEDVQIMQIRPTDAAFLKQLSAEIEEQTREEAVKRQLSADEEIENMRIVLASKLDQEKIEAKRINEIKRAQVALRVQEEKAALLKAQLDARRQELEYQHRILLIEEEQKQTLRVAQEGNALALQELVAAREEANFVTTLRQQLQQAQTDHDTMALITDAEDSKSDAVRHHELARISVERMAEAFGNLPMENAQWLTVGNQSPVETLASLFTSWRALEGNTAKEKTS